MSNKMPTEAAIESGERDDADATPLLPTDG